MGGKKEAESRRSGTCASTDSTEPFREGKRGYKVVDLVLQGENNTFDVPKKDGGDDDEKEKEIRGT